VALLVISAWLALRPGPADLRARGGQVVSARTLETDTLPGALI
jgi:hypothetical protein